MIRPFEARELSLPGVAQISAFQASDERGGMVKAYSREILLEHGIDFTPVESLLIMSKAGVLRGMHFQRVKPQPKLIDCIYGCVWCAIADIRKDSPTFGKWICAELAGGSGEEIYVPSGFAFGSLALEDSLISCQCGERFYAEYDSGIRWDDPELGIQWPLDKDPIISEKDQHLKGLRESTE